jgi:acyl-CoA oxidase
MNFAQVSRDGKFTRTGSEILMYASMLLMRATLCMFGSLLFSMSLTIAIRYSCVRHQTANPQGYFQLTLKPTVY